MWIPTVLVAMTGIAYVNADHEDFLFDSAGELLRNPAICSLGEAWQALWRTPIRPDEQVARFSFAVNYAINCALGFPVFEVTTLLVLNVLIHGINAWLVFRVILSLSAAPHSARRPPVGVALAVAAWFAVHPIHASSIAYVAQRRGAMATTFFLLAILAYLCLRPSATRTRIRASEVGDVQPAARRRRPDWKRFAIGLLMPLCFWLSYRCKSIGLTLPLAILAIEFCLRAPDRGALRRFSYVLFPGLALSVFGMCVFLWSEGLLDLERIRVLPYSTQDLWGPWTHFLTEAQVFVHYWKLMLLPLPAWSSIDHDFALSTNLLDHYGAAAIAFHGLLLAVAVVAAWRRWTLMAIGLFWFYITAIPYAVIPQADLFVEYKTYLPSVGVALILAEVFARAGERIRFFPKVTFVTAATAALLATTIYRNAVYQSPVRLWTDAVAKSPNRARCRTALGNALLAEGRKEEALVHFEQARRISPTSATCYFDLANGLVALGRIDEAIEHYRDALQLKPGYADALSNLGAALRSRGEVEQAIARFEEALRFEPSHSAALTNLGNALRDQGKLNEAMTYYRAAVRANPLDPFAHNVLGAALFREGQTDKAIQAFRQAVSLKPRFTDARFRLGLALARQGQRRQAIDEYREVLKIDPSHELAAAHLRELLQTGFEGQEP